MTSPNGRGVRPLRPDEYSAFVERAMATYVGDMIAAGLDVALARAKADRDFSALLPQGLDTPRHFIYAILDKGRPAGLLWLADRDDELGRSLFVYGVEIDEDHRGRGLGRAAMEFAETEARRIGIPRVALNVFGGNDGARSLYLALGYRETAVHMEKRL